MNPAHLRVEPSCVRHPGGQHVTVTTTRVRVTHVPTGLTAECGEHRSQTRNKAVAIAMIEYGLAELGWVEPPAQLTPPEIRA